MRYKHLIFDFDGVLVESNSIRIEGFRLLFKNYPPDQVRQLLEYATLNGGMSRYKKIRYFFERIRNEPVSNEVIQSLAKQYSDLVKQKVIEAKPVKGSLGFLANNHSNYDFAIVSGSDQEELREICKTRGIEHFFVEILGSPVTKEANIAALLPKMGWEKQACFFIGDSINDLDAARANGIDFIARDSGLLDWGQVDKTTVISDLTKLHLYLA